MSNLKQLMQKIRNSRKGMTPVGWVSTFLTVGLFAAVAAIVIAAVRDTQQTYNVAGNASTGTTVSYAAANNSITAVVNLTSQLGTAGTIAGISVIVLAAVVILGYFGFRQQEQR